MVNLSIFTIVLTMDIWARLACIVRRFVGEHKTRTLISEWLNRLQITLAELSEISKKAFYAMHRESVSESLTEAQLEKVRTSTLMRMAVELRNASEGLCRSCLDAGERFETESGARVAPGQAAAGGEAKSSTKLKIDLTGIKEGFELETVPAQRSIQLIYHLFLQWDDSPHELCIEGPLLDLQSARDEGGVLAAYRASRMDQEATIIIEDDPSCKFFRSRLPRDTERLFTPNVNALGPTLWVSSSLAAFLDDLDKLSPDDRLRAFPLSERIRLAFKIVECGLLLSGTSWLSRMGSRSLHRSPSSKVDNYHYTIDLNITTGRSWKDLKQLAAHIFRIGIVLLEIGFGKRVLDFRLCLLGSLEFLLSNLGTDPYNQDTYMSIGPIKQDLTTTIDSEYASVTAYCLEQIVLKCGEAKRHVGDAIDYEYKKILEDYFVKIYSPMHSKACHLAFMAEIVGNVRDLSLQ